MKYLFPLLLLIFVFPAYAQEEAEDTSSVYSPAPCEFTITFPDEPYTVRRCDKEQRDECYDLVSYTQVYDLSSTVNFRVICNPIKPDIHEAYSAEVMEATLRAMTKGSSVNTADSSFREGNGYKQAGLVGEGRVGREPMIYIAQLWIGEKSAFSVEAELIGEEQGAADTLFGDVLRSIGYKKEMEKAKPAARDTETEVKPSPGSESSQP